jgi:hypothetical protein
MKSVVQKRLEVQGASTVAASEVPHEAPSRPEHPLPMDRSEEMLDQMGHQFGVSASRAGRGFLKALGRACEEAEDVWAEAQNIRQRNRNGNH